MLLEKYYCMIMMNVECPYFHKGNLTKHKKQDTGALRTTSWYSRVPICNCWNICYCRLHVFNWWNCIWKKSKVRDVFDSAWETILAASNPDRIVIACYTYPEVSIKELTRTGRAKEEPIEIINLNLDSPVSTEVRKFWAFSIRKERLQIFSRNYFLIKRKEKENNMIFSGK